MEISVSPTLITEASHYILMLRNSYKHYFGILAKDKILFFGSGKVAYPSAVKLYENCSNLHFVTHHTPER